MKLTISVVVFLQLCAQLLADPIPEQRVLSRCTDSDFVVTVDNQYELYIDGARVSSGLPNSDSWTAADRVRVPASARVIAIKGVDVGVVAGILASGAHSTTDGSWKCTNRFHNGWAGVRFDDSAWPAATEIGSHGVPPWGTISGISREAKWIWTPRHTGGDRTVYCRKKRGCTNEPTGTGPSCITSCAGRASGDYQFCKGCGVYASCASGGILFDERPCAAGGLVQWRSHTRCVSYATGLVWDDNVKRCEWKSTTCSTGNSEPIDPPRPPIDPPRPSCITSCAGRTNGDYQSCTGCRVYATCSNGHLYDQRPCPSGLVWDDKLRRCEWKSTTCSTGANEQPGTGPSCITSCAGRASGDYQSCKGCDVYASCASGGILFDARPCAAGGLVWDDNVKRCEWKSTTCT